MISVEGLTEVRGRMTSPRSPMLLTTSSIRSPISNCFSAAVISPAPPPTWHLHLHLTRAGGGSRPFAHSVPSSPRLAAGGSGGPSACPSAQSLFAWSLQLSHRVHDGTRSPFIFLLCPGAWPQVWAWTVKYLTEGGCPCRCWPTGCHSGMHSKEMRGHLCRLLAARLTRGS